MYDNVIFNVDRDDITYFILQLTVSSVMIENKNLEELSTSLKLPLLPEPKMYVNISLM